MRRYIYKRNSSVGIGAISLLMVFVVLCMTIFATLSVVQAKANLKVSEKYRDSIIAYQKAEVKAIKMKQEIQDRLLQGFGVDDLGVSENEGFYSYSIKIDDTSYLNVELQVVNNNIEITKWCQQSNYMGDYGNIGFDF